MTEARAKLLASTDRHYAARQLRNGEWIVWDAVSDHEVEFDFATEMEAVGAGLAS